MDTMTERRISTLGTGFQEALGDEDVSLAYQVHLPENHTIVAMFGKTSRRMLAIRLDENVEPVDLDLDTFRNNHLECADTLDA